MRVAVSADEATGLAEALIAHLEAAGHEVTTPVPMGTAWPDVGRSVAEEVARGQADVGVVCCWTGTGVSMAANKVPGVRAALCGDVETAEGARRWNDANVLALSLHRVAPGEGTAILDAFLATAPDDDERPNFSRLD